MAMSPERARALVTLFHELEAALACLEDVLQRLTEELMLADPRAAAAITREAAEDIGAILRRARGEPG